MNSAPRRNTTGATQAQNAHVASCHANILRNECPWPSIAVHKGRQYQFVSEPNRARFAGEPDRYSIQNDACPVVVGAPIDPSFFAVHEGRIYGFATADCVQALVKR